MRKPLPDLWPCPRCGERFTTRNQQHACGRFDLDALFARSEPQVRALYDAFVALAGECGPVRVIPQKSRIALQVRMRFAAVTPQQKTLAGHLVLKQRHDEACFEWIEQLGPRTYRHVFRLSAATELKPLRRWIREAYRVGAQEHLSR